MPIDVPAHVEYAHYVENHVQVKAGNNWDFSRTAIVTPIVVMPEPVVQPSAVPAPRFQAEDGLPSGEPLTAVHFTDEGVTLLPAHRKALLALDKNARLFVAAHADAKESDANRLSRIRAKAVTTFLRSKGYTVETVKAFGSSRPITEGAAEENRAVVVYATGVSVAQ
jgi:outer membrane protein OmpA-like peptidoglycan-associated protein